MTDQNSRPQGGPCPICDDPSTQRYRPFCTKRCADIDLGRWMTGRYSSPVEEEPGDGASGPD